ncbi:hypothetical protein ASU31_17265 [Pedobacter ginsenosidimutans]|uniref:Uncharacterized protein n=1 Tax=Pedobacter ginsenosidimutans TaxID=687842 RepID=A0A0T5VPF4_9SPHI|nr:hypothetical protein [Pedobacter ginsenosidimutans]KRT15061.1 hypothetical protein ASU31_17265 [Pedobacter ginsenosidimutans]
MQGINRRQHEHLKNLLIKLEENIEAKEDDLTDEEGIRSRNELESIKSKRLQMQAMYIEYLKKLAEIEIHIALYRRVYTDVSVNFVSGRIRKLNKAERL